MRKVAVILLFATLLPGIVVGDPPPPGGYPPGGYPPGSIIYPVDPSAMERIGIWLEVVRFIQNAIELVHNINDKVEKFRNLQSWMYPRKILDSINVYFRGVESLAGQIERLACDWRFSPRVGLLRSGIFGDGICKTEYQRVFGEPLGVDSDMKEIWQWANTRRLNVAGRTIAAGADWAESAAAFASRVRAGGVSPCLAVRQEASLEAANLQVDARDNTVEAELLDAAQERLDKKMLKRWQRKNLAQQIALWTLYRLEDQERDR